MRTVEYGTQQRRSAGERWGEPLPTISFNDPDGAIKYAREVQSALRNLQHMREVEVRAVKITTIVQPIGEET